MKKRIPYVILLFVAIAGWWISDNEIVPWVQPVAGYDQIQNRDLSILLGHWIFGQLTRVLVCVAIWLIGSRVGLMPSFRQSFTSGGSWRVVIRTGLIATAVLLVLEVGIGAVAGAAFGFHPYFPKMAGDIVSNMYEEIVYRGLMFCALYGVAATACFPLNGKPDRAGLVAGIVGSCVVFALGHEQYSVALRVVVGMVAVVFAYPWIAARSLWAPWIPHTLGDIIVDSILKL
jgi:hypothetical protein